MMPKGLIAFIVVACIGFASMFVMFLKRSADEAHKKSDTIVEEFKRVEESLKKSNANIDSSNKKLFVNMDAATKKLLTHSIAAKSDK